MAGSTTTAFDPAIHGEIDAASIDLRRVLTELAFRKIESLKLYTPMPFQQSFHESRAPERLITGGNRAGKSIAAAVECARVITGQDPLGRYPKENGVCYIVGKQGREVSQVLYPILFKPGAFKMIRDEHTKEWRAYNPQTDKHREKERRPALSLVPRRMVKQVAWLDKKLGLPSLVVLRNGWHVYFYSSEAKPTQGSSVDYCWFDEEILERDWYGEISARLVDRMGYFVWSATPQEGTERLYALAERAKSQVEEGVWPRSIEHFESPLESNTYLEQSAKDILTEKFSDDEDMAAVRLRGEFIIIKGRVYPEYSGKIHEVDPFKIPPTWTRYAAIDPGRQTCAVLFAAVPPPDEGDFVYFYDELYLHECTAAIFGREMAAKSVGQTFRAFLIDMREARKTDVGSGKKLLAQYAEQLKLNNVRSQITGHEFIAGNDNMKAGLEAFRFWLSTRTDGTCKLRVFRTLEKFRWEMKRYRHKKIGEYFVDEPIKKNDHLMDCARYLAQYGPCWIAPAAAPVEHSKAYAWYLKEQKKKRGKMMHLGPGIPK